ATTQNGGGQQQQQAMGSEGLGPPQPTIESTEGWPERLIAGPGSGPALYLNERPDAPEVGYVSPGTEFELAGERTDDRIKVYIGGGLKIRAWMTMDRVSARVQKRGKIPDTNVSLGPNDVVRVLGPSDREGILRVEARPYLGRGPNSTLGAEQGIYPADRLGVSEVNPNEVEQPTPGEPHRLPAGEEVPVYDKPGGEVIARLPALDPPLRVVVLRQRDPWKGVRVGVGPYLVGYIDAPLEAADSAPSGGGLIGEPARDGPIPARLQAEEQRPLWRLKKDARVYFYDDAGERHVFAIVKEDGYAREMNRYEEQDEVDVFAAVDDRLAVRGLVLARSLEEHEPGSESDEPGGGDAEGEGEGGFGGVEAESDEPEPEPAPTGEDDESGESEGESDGGEASDDE
ncbi:MAG: hypothetical protein ACOCUS_02040, partial [Polyangiales bacterium]